MSQGSASASGATPVLLRDVATVQVGPEMRRGIAELDGQGEVAGGVVVMRSGKNARTTIEAVKARLEALKPSLPRGVEVVETYDRSRLIDRAVDNLREKLAEEFIVVALVCAPLALAHAATLDVTPDTLIERANLLRDARERPWDPATGRMDARAPVGPMIVVEEKPQ